MVYDKLGQVTSGKRYWADNTPVAGQQFEYGFDDIGNRNSTKAGGDQNGAGLRPALYTNNIVNQITGRGVPGAVDVMGLSTNAVKVNGNTNVYHYSGYFWQNMTVANSTPQYPQILVEAGTSSVLGNTLVPPAIQNCLYDADGNMMDDCLWNYTWDAENRLLKMESMTTVPTAARLRVEFNYDWRGRRITKKTTRLSDSAITLNRKFVYDGWNLLLELDAANNQAVIRSYTWGKDLSGTLQGVGGVGGLLSVYDGTSTYFVAYDANGNVAGLAKSSNGQILSTTIILRIQRQLKITVKSGL